MLTGSERTFSPMIKTRGWTASLLGAALGALVLAYSGHAEAQQKVVVELFTSQGCSSCPPADRFLGELAKRDDVMALSLHVDYWDYLGWKDTLATPETTRRQRDYAQRFSQRYVYTPQTVVNGIGHNSGLRKKDTADLIAKAGGDVKAKMNIDHATSGHVTVSVVGGHIAEPADVYLMLFDDQKSVAIECGENAGKSVEYHNVVREVRRIATWDGAPLSLDLDVSGAGGCAVIVQTAGLGPSSASPGSTLGTERASRGRPTGGLLRRPSPFP